MTCEHEQKRPPLPSFLPFPSITQSRNDVDSCVNTVRSLAKTRPSPLVVETEVTISEAATQGYFRLWCHLSTNQSLPPSMSSTVTLEELQKGGGGSFTIKPAVTIAAVGRRRFAYHSCVECRKKTTQGCVQHPTAKTTARYCLRIQLKQEDISMWSTAFHDVAESILGVSVEDFEELNDDQRRTVVWPAIGMRYNMTMRKTVGGVYTNYTVESIDTEPIV